MNYSTISGDLELISVLNKIFIRKKLTPSSSKGMNSSNHSYKHREPQSPFPKQYIKVNVLPNHQRIAVTEGNKQLITPNKYYYSPRQFKSSTEPTEPNGFTDSDALYKMKRSSVYRRKIKHKSFSNGDNPVNCLQLSMKSSQTRNQCNSIYQRKISVDSFIEQRKKENFFSSTNPDELIVLESKVNSLLSVVSKGKDCRVACCDLWQFYVKSSFINQQQDYFQKKLSKVIIHSLSNLFMLVIILTYDISFEFNLFVQLNLLFKTIFTLLQLNYILLAKYIMSHLNANDPLIRDFTSFLNERVNGETPLDFDEIEVCLMIKHNSTSIVDLIRLILNNISQENSTYQELLEQFNNISNIDSNEIIQFFKGKIFRKDSQQSRGLLIQRDSTAPVFSLRLKEPYLPLKKSAKQYTLLLSLDEVLVSYSCEEKRGILYLRPGLMNFLTIVRELFEVIIFTSATKEYVKPILQVIEQDKKYIDHCLYREHCFAYSNERIKDLSKIGRDLSKVIIVDNNAKNFKLNKSNGILIHSFFGYDTNDSTLYKLQSILVRIAKETNGNDIRKVLVDYHNEITQTISSDIYMRKSESQLNPIVLNISNDNSNNDIGIDTDR